MKKATILGMAAAIAATVLLAGCPAEEKQTDTTTTTTTSTAPESAATAETTSTTTTTTAATGSAEASKGATVAAAGGIDAKAIFSQKCAGCHGANGGGGMGPSLQHVAAKGDALIKERIDKGSATKGMPAFGDSGMLKPAEIDALVTYVKTL